MSDTLENKEEQKRLKKTDMVYADLCIFQFNRKLMSTLTEMARFHDVRH